MTHTTICTTCERIGRTCFSCQGKDMNRCDRCSRPTLDTGLCANCQAAATLAAAGHVEPAESSAGLDIGYAAGREAREANPTAYYGSGVVTLSGCSCTPERADCPDCRE